MTCLPTFRSYDVSCALREGQPVRDRAVVVVLAVLEAAVVTPDERTRGWLVSWLTQVALR